VGDGVLWITEETVRAIGEATSAEDLSRAMEHGLASLGFKGGSHKNDNGKQALDPPVGTWPGEFMAEYMSAVAVIGNAAAIKAELLNPGSSSAQDENHVARVLSTVQAEILKWASEGKSNRDIADIMSLSKRGVDYHMSEILRKLGVVSRTQAIAKWNGS
jgi:DNA-binding CsgD family transcriptional regulator